MVVTINANIKKQAIIIFGFTRYSNCETIWSTGVSGRKIYSEIGRKANPIERKCQFVVEICYYHIFNNSVFDLYILLIYDISSISICRFVNANRIAYNSGLIVSDSTRSFNPPLSVSSIFSKLP